MTSAVVTAGLDADVLQVAQLMRDHNVGSVVLSDPHGEPVAMVTDRDLAIRSLAEGRPSSEPISEHASRPLVTGEPDMDLEEAAAADLARSIRDRHRLDGARPRSDAERGGSGLPHPCGRGWRLLPDPSGVRGRGARRGGRRAHRPAGPDRRLTGFP